MVINRPAEEPGYPLENAFDRNPATWFRTVRNWSVKSGPHEFVLSLGGRRVIDGFRIAPRNDKWWKYGQVRKYEIYMSDINGDWNDPVVSGTLELKEEMHTIHFPPAAGSLLRFRVLSTHDMEIDPMVLSADRGKGDSAYNAFIPVAVNPVTISEFQLLEHQQPDGPRRTIHLSDEEWSLTQSRHGTVTRHQLDGASSNAGMRMNGLRFPRGLAVEGDSRIDFQLLGNWQVFRVDAGIEDSRADGKVRFQVYGDDRLLYDSGPVETPSMVKPELDIRGIRILSLRTVVVKGQVTANWANATITGFSGDKVGD